MSVAFFCKRIGYGRSIPHSLSFFWFVVELLAMSSERVCVYEYSNFHDDDDPSERVRIEAETLQSEMYYLVLQLSGSHATWTILP